LNAADSCSRVSLFDYLGETRASWDQDLPAGRREPEQRPRGELVMNSALLKLYVIFQDLRSREEGQDLVEYALMLTLISLALISGMSGIASAIKNIFSNISTSLA
jgi:pilus assembly protein Flp/PilA